MKNLTGFQRDLVYIIAGLNKPHGLALKDEIDAYYEDEVNHGRLYPNLDSLVESGLIKKGTIDKRTNFYELTSEGVSAIAAREEWEQNYIAELATVTA
jgi:DNA-binding PadR family transcriptional regulator